MPSGPPAPWQVWMRPAPRTSARAAVRAPVSAVRGFRFTARFAVTAINGGQRVRQTRCLRNGGDAGAAAARARAALPLTGVLSALVNDLTQPRVAPRRGIAGSQFAYCDGLMISRHHWIAAFV